MNLSKVNKYVKRACPFVYEKVSTKMYDLFLKKVSAILAKEEPPKKYDCEEIFNKLQNTYESLPEYGYDPYSTWKRGVLRANHLLEKNENLRTQSLRVLDAACGDGMLGYALQSYGHNVQLVDFEDWRDSRAINIPFLCASLSRPLPFESNSLDFICSYNAFEHIDDPSACFKELLRICKPEGHIYLEFGPLYASPWGLHAYRTLRIPYSQFLFSEEFISEKLEKLGINDLGQKKTSLQPLNRWRVKQFCDLWSHPDCRIVWNDTLIDTKFLQIIKTYYKAFQGQFLAIEDVTTQTLFCLIQKK